MHRKSDERSWRRRVRHPQRRVSDLKPHLRRSFRKSIDGYAVCGPWMVTADEIPDPDNVPFTISVNGELRQDAHSSDLIYDIRRLIEFASSFYTLHPGDLYMTGSPQGVGPVVPGDVMHAECAQIGAMDVLVRANS